LNTLSAGFAQVLNMSAPPDDLRDLCLVIRRALLMIVQWIEKRYGLRPRD
jgi:hypothetical protein